MKPYAERTAEEMMDVLMNPNESGPDIHYYMIRGGKEKTNVTIMESGTVGGEYIKTFGHYHVMDFEETYSVVAGEGLLLLQYRKKDENGEYIDGEIEKFEVIKIKAGDKISIPSFAGHLLVNTGGTWLVTIDDSPVLMSGDSASAPKHADYEAVRKMRGFAYYVVMKDGAISLVRNGTYRSVPEAPTLD